MLTLKIVETVNEKVDGIFVREKEHYHELGFDPKVEYIEDYGAVARVTASDISIFIHAKQSAYLVNDQGKTLKVINRATD